VALPVGTTLGPYEVTGSLGAGGMGEVYEANDTRLGRTVAVKVLPEHLSNDAARRERFEREARAVSSLNHPNICTLYDVGEHDGIHYLVMELIEGETLSARLKKGALPLDKALEIAGQIADGLAAAHRAGIVHRDLKPGNVMLTKPGVKLLDFGLAKTREEPIAPTDDSEQPTQNKPLTDAGTVLGTVQYMAPEQLEGKEVDARADLFALGAILFEIVTGRRAFEGESQASLISAIMLTDPPPVSELESLSPPALDGIVKSCLAKDPAERWHSAHDLRTQLGWVASTPAAAHETPTSTHKWRWATVPAALLAVLAVGAFFANNFPRPAVAPLYLDIKIPAADTLSVQMGRPGVTLSPDGSRLAYVASRADGPAQIFIRPLDGFEATPLAGTEGAQHPFFSPDGESIAFVSGLNIQRISLRVGSPIKLAPYDGFSFAGVDWLPNGDLVLGAWNYPLRRVSSTDGSIEDLTTLGSARGHAWPDVLPNGKAVLFTDYEGGGMDRGSIVVEWLDTGERRTLLQGVFARYVPSGHVIYVREQNVLSAAPFDLKTLSVTGPGVPAISDVLVTPAWSPDLGFSERGDVAYVAGVSTMARRLEMADNRELRTEAYTSVRVSPRGDRLVVSLLHEVAEAWVYDFLRDTITRLPTELEAHSPIWSADESRIVFTSNRDGQHNLHMIAADGSGDVERLTTSPNQQIPGSISPDAMVLAFSQGRGETQGWDIYLLPLDGSGEATPFLTTNDSEYSPMFSPDGKWLAYVSDESGESAVYVRPFPGPGPGTRISPAGGREPVWAPDGRELHYLATNGTITSVELHYDPALRAGTSRVGLSGGTVSTTLEENAYDVMPDGSFVVIRESDQNINIRFVTNWFEELERLAPPDN
jgi:serine/threonine protein kinase/Tol biopolymer transport system component